MKATAGQDTTTPHPTFRYTGRGSLIAPVSLPESVITNIWKSLTNTCIIKDVALSSTSSTRWESFWCFWQLVQLFDPRNNNLFIIQRKGERKNPLTIAGLPSIYWNLSTYKMEIDPNASESENTVLLKCEELRKVFQRNVMSQILFFN